MNTNSTHLTVTTYDEIENLPKGTIVRVNPASEEILNAGDYELFQVGELYGVPWLTPQRENIVADYSEYGSGYLIQQVDEKYRHITLEQGEEDTFGNLTNSEAEATRAAFDEWKELGDPEAPHPLTAH